MNKSSAVQGKLLVDAHAHIFTSQMPLAVKAWSRPSYDFTAEDFVSLLDRNQIAYGVISAASIFDDDNAYTLAALEKYDRLRATVIVAPTVSKRELINLAQAGVVGVRFQWRTDGPLPDISSVEMKTHLRRIADAGLHVELLAHGRRMTELLPQLTAQGVDIVVDHLGDPDRTEGLEGPGFSALLGAVESGGVWVKISALGRLPVELAAQAVVKLIEISSTDRLMWGSDAPFVGHEADTTYEDTLASFAAVLPDEALRRRVSETAYKLFFK